MQQSWRECKIEFDTLTVDNRQLKEEHTRMESEMNIVLDQLEQVQQQNVILQRTAAEHALAQQGTQQMQQAVDQLQLLLTSSQQDVQQWQTVYKQAQQACLEWQHDAQQKQHMLQAVKPLLVYLGNMNVTYHDASEMLWTDDAFASVEHAQQVVHVLKKQAEEYDSNMAHVKHQMEQCKLENTELQQRLQDTQRQVQEDKLEREIAQTKEVYILFQVIIIIRHALHSNHQQQQQRNHSNNYCLTFKNLSTTWKRKSKKNNITNT